METKLRHFHFNCAYYKNPPKEYQCINYVLITNFKQHIDCLLILLKLSRTNPNPNPTQTLTPTLTRARNDGKRHTRLNSCFVLKVLKELISFLFIIILILISVFDSNVYLKAK